MKALNSYLISYHYYKNVNLDKFFSDVETRVFVDCGAWSAFTLGKKIDINQYCEFLDKWKHYITIYANLDDMENPDITLKNQQYMESQGFSPLPAVHVGEPWDYLNYYAEKYKYVAIGRVIPYGTNKKTIMPWMIKAFRIAENKCVYHGFGVTNFNLLKSFPWYSVDSSTFSSSARWGRVPLFDSKSGLLKTAKLGNRNSCYRYERVFRDLGFDPAIFSERENNTRYWSFAIGAESYARIEKWMRNYWGEIKYDNVTGRNVCDYDETQNGLILYLSPSSGPHECSYKYEKERMRDHV